LAQSRRIIAADCETDPFLHKRDPEPFLWGAYDGSTFRTFNSTEEFVAWASVQRAVIYFHNGGKFDAMFLLLSVLKLSEEGKPVKAQIIGSRIVKIQLGKAELRDSYAAIPEALSMFGKKEIEYEKMERAVRHLHMPEIIEYLEQDCVSLFDLITEYRKIAGTKLTIASNALTFSKELGIDPGKTNASFDEVFRDFYYGGRTECFRPGTHRGINIVDIRSAYPTAMMQDHPCGSEYVHTTIKEFKALPVEAQQRCFITLECFVKQGCFPQRTKTGLDFPTGWGEYHVTGWEYIAALELGLFEREKIKNVIRLSEKINFGPYIDHWFKYKASHNKKTQPIQYNVGKRMMNALYGKLAQNPARYYDYIYVRGGTEVDFENGWELAAEYGDIEVHRREALWKYKQNFGDDWRGRPLYNNVATGASITGLARSYLLKAIHKVGARHIIYCDTDSLIVAKEGDISVLPQSEKLGDWELEAANCPIGHFAGKKLYGIDLGNSDKCKCNNPLKKDCKRHKIATKGGKLSFGDIERIIKGEKVTWENPAPSFTIAGEPKYVVRSFRSTASKPLEI